MSNRSETLPLVAFLSTPVSCFSRPNFTQFMLNPLSLIQSGLSDEVNSKQGKNVKG